MENKAHTLEALESVTQRSPGRQEMQSWADRQQTATRFVTVIWPIIVSYLNLSPLNFIATKKQLLWSEKFWPLLVSNGTETTLTLLNTNTEREKAFEYKEE